MDPISDQRSKNRITLYTRICNIHLILMTAYKSIVLYYFFKWVWLSEFWLTVCGLGSRLLITTRFSVFKKKKKRTLATFYLSQLDTRMDRKASTHNDKAIRVLGTTSNRDNGVSGR